VTVLVDTSALLALLDEDDAEHQRAATAWPDLLDDATLLTHAYVVVETSALVQRRLGMAAVERLHGHLLPAVDVRMVSRDQHGRAVARWRQEARRGLSLVDVASFVVMEDAGVARAFAFDEDFAAVGFHVVPDRGGRVAP
jgi:predicted nucleic acid-binding protein